MNYHQVVYSFWDVKVWMDKHWALVVIIVGCLLNFLSIAVHLRKEFRSTSLGFLLIALALSLKLDLFATSVRN
jgi:hypothetical protein